jgi:hypothetical protein
MSRSYSQAYDGFGRLWYGMLGRRKNVENAGNDIGKFVASSKVVVESAGD